MTQISMFTDPLDERIKEWAQRIAAHDDWEYRIDFLFDGFSGGMSQSFCYEIRNKKMMYSDKGFNSYEPGPDVRTITKEEFKERVKEWL